MVSEWSEGETLSTTTWYCLTNEQFSESEGNAIENTDTIFLQDDKQAFSWILINLQIPSFTDNYFSEYQNFTSSWNKIKEEINDYFNNDNVSLYNIDNDTNTEFTTEINILISSYNTYLNNWSWFLANYNFNKNLINDINTEFNENINNDSYFSNFDFTDKETKINSSVLIIWTNSSQPSETTWITKNLNDTITKLNTNKQSINDLYTKFIENKLDIKNNIKNTFDSYKESNFVSVPDYEDETEVVKDYLNLISSLQDSSFTGFTLSDFKNNISTYTWIILYIKNLETSISNNKNDLSWLEFNLFDENNNIKTGDNINTISTASWKVADINIKINNFYNKVESWSDLFEIIQNKKDDFDIFLENNRTRESLNIIEENRNKSSSEKQKKVNNENLARNGVMNMINKYWDSLFKNSSWDFKTIFSIADIASEYDPEVKQKMVDDLNKRLNKRKDEEDKKVNIPTLGQDYTFTKSNSNTTKTWALNDLNLAISDNTKNVTRNIQTQNLNLVNYVKDVSWNNSLEKSDDAEGKINLIKWQAAYLNIQEENLTKNIWKIKGCEPEMSITWDDWKKYAWPEWIIPCSKSEFKKDIKKEKWTTFDWVFNLISDYTKVFDWFKNNLLSTTMLKWNLLVDWNWKSFCKPWTFNLWNWCVDVNKIKTRWIAYWSDAWAIVMDPFNCNLSNDPRKCLIKNNWFRLSQSWSNIIMKWIIYSTEAWPIKFWWISTKFDAKMDTINKNSNIDNTSENKENKFLINNYYNDIYSNWYLNFTDSNWNYVSELTLSSSLNSIFTNNYSDFSQENLYWDENSRIQLIRDWIKAKFYDLLAKYKKEKVLFQKAYDSIPDLENVSFSDWELDKETLYNYNKMIVDRIIWLNKLDEFIDDNYNWKYTGNVSDFESALSIYNYNNFWLYSYINKNYNTLNTILEPYLKVVKKSSEKIALNITWEWDLIWNIQTQNNDILSYTETWWIKWDNLQEQIFDIKSKLNNLKIQLKYIRLQEDALMNYWKIDWCEPWKTFTLYWITFNNAKKLPCSKRKADDLIVIEKNKLLDRIFVLTNTYKDKKLNYLNSLDISEKWQMMTDWDWKAVCSIWKINLWNWCIDPSNIKIKWIAYWTDAWSVILDPFKCSNKSTKNEIDLCRDKNNWLRFQVENWILKLVWIAYSSELWPIKFWWSNVLDWWFSTTNNTEILPKSCKELKDKNPSATDWKYMIDPDWYYWQNEAFETECTF